MKLSVYNKESKAPKPNQPIQPGACAVILNENGLIFLHKRSDTKLWALPGGTLELGESISQCCLREIKEETNLKAALEKMIGVYTSPNCVFEWNNGKSSKVWQIFVIAFLCRVENDKVVLNSESTDAGWFSKEEIEKLKTLPYVKEVISDALHKKTAYFD